jgi:hypothetical protein
MQVEQISPSKLYMAFCCSVEMAAFTRTWDKLGSNSPRENSVYLGNFRTGSGELALLSVLVAGFSFFTASLFFADSLGVDATLLCIEGM